MGDVGRKVLIIDDDADIANLVDEVLSEDGYAVTIVRDARIEAIQEVVAELEPDCMLLDGGVGSGYGASWESAAQMAARLPAVPVIMFTAHAGASAEAMEHTSERSQAAGFAAVLRKPFNLTELLRAVEVAVGDSHRSDQPRSAQLLQALRISWTSISTSKGLRRNVGAKPSRSTALIPSLVRVGRHRNRSASHEPASRGARAPRAPQAAPLHR